MTLSPRQAKRARKLAENLRAQAVALIELAQALEDDPAKALGGGIFDLADEIGGVVGDLEGLADTASRTIHDENLI